MLLKIQLIDRFRLKIGKGTGNDIICSIRMIDLQKAPCLCVGDYLEIGLGKVFSILSLLLHQQTALHS